MNRNQLGFGAHAFLMLVLVFSAVALSGAFVYHRHKHKNKDVTTTTVEHVQKSNGTTSVDIEAPVSKTENCGTPGCFEKKFQACEPATLTSSLPDIGKVSYQITEAKNGGCSMTFTFIKNGFNPAFNGKTMTCTFDNKLKFETAIDKVFNDVTNKGKTDCTGSLVKALQSLGN